MTRQTRGRRSALDVQQRGGERVNGCVLVSSKAVACVSEQYSLQINPLKLWLPYRDAFLDEMIRHEGMAKAEVNEAEGAAGLPLCHDCKCPGATLRCIDCVAPHMRCRDCASATHQLSPLHRLQRWNGFFFADYSLSQAGLVVQLGHDGLPCPHPQTMATPLTVIDVTGIHEVRYNLCACGIIGASRPFVQLLRAQWWPATVSRPRTVVTMRTLRLFHALTLQSKVNAYDFWNGLVRITDGAGLKKTKYRYKEFIRCIRCYRHLRMVKRGGRAHHPEGISGTKPGELVVPCPACPDPATNLPEGWDKVPKSEKWKYALLLAIDANFKLKRKNRKTHDVQLMNGWSYFVEEAAYQGHLNRYKDEAEMKYCSSTHSAWSSANMPAEKRFAINGVGAAICARHLFYRAQGVGDLQRGERYMNMDYIVLSSLTHTRGASELNTFFFSYDISCQWNVNFYRRLAERFPDHALMNDGKTVTFLIPKFHLLAHGQSCQLNFSLNYTEGVARTCGEGIEAGWADTNGAALSTREMSPGFRHEALDDLFGAINWRKFVSMGVYLLKGLRDAYPEYVKKMKIHNDFEATFPRAVIAQWEEMLHAWEENHKRPNPYKEMESSNTMASVRLELGLEEAEEAARGAMALHEMSASVFLTTGFELEEQQYVLGQRAKKTLLTPVEKATLQTKRNTLQHRIQKWRAIQQIYMPGCASVVPPEALAGASALSSTGSRSGDVFKPEAAKLYLPSGLPDGLRSSGCTAGLVDKEARLREADADDALHQIRRQLRVRLAFVHHKKIHVDGPGQHAQTRAHATYRNISEKLRRYVTRYRRSRAALEILRPGGTWTAQLLPLLEEDIRSPTMEEEGLGEGRRELSWIWRVQQQDERDLPQASDEDLHEGMRAEWAQGRARARRWDEEVQTRLEEMRRTVISLIARADAWMGRLDSRPNALPDIQRGLKGYAHRQAAIYMGLARSFYRLWEPAVKALGLAVEWPAALLSITLSSPSPDEPIVIDQGLDRDWESDDEDSEALDVSVDIPSRDGQAAACSPESCLDSGDSASDSDSDTDSIAWGPADDDEGEDIGGALL
ncbi:hypothetical protein BV25DRAFT_1816736 [Artomyces pyxidatus]|uniref:Uncharacterized protein n=1 Tax=Artomyces pyxidatus TaxID=48021 RepID=A0ACB8SDV3_9AGAM|nr:hypothetical protein BV25DRAFT_1816736 [Artomyces pyxidatus]